MDEKEIEVRSPIKRLGSTRKLLLFNNIRIQLLEQLRCLDIRMETQVSIVMELQEYFRRRGDLELEYARNLDKLARSLQMKHKEQKQKREQWHLFSSFSCWHQLIIQTKNLSRDHMALADLYSVHLVGRLGQIIEDLQRIYRRCREIGQETHEEILRILHELNATMKTYHSYQADLNQAEKKLKTAELQRDKIEASIPQEKLDRSKKYKIIEKEVSKRKNKYTDAKLKALKAKTEYELCLEATNTTIHKYFVDDLSDIMDCMDFGFHNCITRALLMHVTAEQGRQKSIQFGLDSLSTCINGLDSRVDKQKFLEFNHNAFMIPKKIEFQHLKADEAVLDTPPEPEIKTLLHKEMRNRLSHLSERVTTLRAESDEIWKTLETTETSLMDMVSAKDYDCSQYFGENATALVKVPECVTFKLRSDRQETEEFYLAKFREYLLGTTKIARLDSKQEYLRQYLLAVAPELGQLVVKPPVTKTPKRKRIGRLQISGQPKLFGGSIEEYQEATNQDIPLIMRSCIRVINLYGLHHQGIFRVSGSQVEINNFREWFERGEDPLADMTDASDINSVAGVLKLYLRELREPLFPTIYFEHFMQLAQLESKREFVTKMRELVVSLPRPIMIVLRYLFAFLNHLSEFSDENMMDPYNLAICFGPTLVPVPDDKDQVQYQNQVNELIKNIIIYYDDIFPNDGGTVYEKYISPHTDYQEIGDAPLEQTQDETDVCPSEDDSDSIEATAQFDFAARSDRELSLKKGDVVVLYSQISSDWWRGAINGQEGLVPDKYISLKMKDEEREKISAIIKSSSSEESVQRRASSSNDSVLSESSASMNNSPIIQCTQMTWTKVSETGLSHSSDDPSITIPTPNTTVIMNQSRENNLLPKTIDSNRNSPVLLHRNTSGDVAPTNNVNIIDLPNSNEAKNENIENPIQEAEIDESNVNFNQNRELWQRRANLEATVPPASPLLKNHRLSEPYMSRQNHTPDLVMDLPLLVASSAKEQISKSMLVVSNSHLTEPSPVVTEKALIPDVESPEMQTAAETFAKQNQNTLKKNTKIHIENSELVAITSPMTERKYATLGSTSSSTSTFKPQMKSKPLVLKKPIFSTVPLRSVSTEMICKDTQDLPT